VQSGADPPVPKPAKPPTPVPFSDVAHAGAIERSEPSAIAQATWLRVMRSSPDGAAPERRIKGQLLPPFAARCKLVPGLHFDSNTTRV
jgi:hypothetical protein